MATAPLTVRLDAADALRAFDVSGMPAAIRNNLRRTIPDLTKRLGAKIEEKLNTELKSRTRLKVDKQVKETSSGEISGSVTVRWTGDSSKDFIPIILDTGARAHEIRARNASALFFFWEKVGANVMFKSVQHPGFPGIHYMQRSLAEMETEIKNSIQDAVSAAGLEPEDIGRSANLRLG